MMEKPKCSSCNSEMEEVEKQTVAGTTYVIWKCKKCKRSVAKS